MLRNQLPGTDLTVSQICLGTWQFNDGDSSEQSLSTWKPQTRETSQAIFDKALQLGVNFIDTAEGYKNSEKVLGSCLEGKRQSVILASKFGYCKPAGEPAEYTATDIETHLLRSLTALQTDYLDIYQVHWPVVMSNVSDTVKELKRQQSLGRIKYYGVCNSGVQNMQDFVNAGGKPITNQLPYNLLWRAIERDIVPSCDRHGISILAYSPLQQGLLTGKFTSAEQVPEGRRRTRHFNKNSTALSRHGCDGAEKETFQTIARLRELCGGELQGVGMSGASLSWLLSRPRVHSVIVGATSVGQVESNCNSLQINVSQDVLERMTECSEELKAVLGPQVDMWAHVSRIT